MSSDNIAAKPGIKDESQDSGGRKTTPTRPQEQGLKCPRCDSPNTKFCYYNNYSLSQPRHFCKTCRRYWTKGGALRNVPIGGGCRKNTKIKSSTRLSGDSKDSAGASSEIGGLKLFHGLSPAMDFQLGGLSLPRLHSSTTSLFNQFPSFGDISASSTPISSSACFGFDPSAAAPTSGNTSLIGCSFPFNSMLKQGENIGSVVNNVGIHQEMGSMNVSSSLASSIESLSSINQDLHWKLQQQRLAMLFGGGESHRDHHHQGTGISPDQNHQIQKPQPIMFQNLEISSKQDLGAVGTNSRKDGVNCTNLETEWFFDNSIAPVNPTPTRSSSNGNDDTSNWNGIQAWNSLHQYTALP